MFLAKGLRLRLEWRLSSCVGNSQLCCLDIAKDSALVKTRPSGTPAGLNSCSTVTNECADQIKQF